MEEKIARISKRIGNGESYRAKNSHGRSHPNPPKQKNDKERSNVLKK
jgi:hypothetical protein